MERSLLWQGLLQVASGALLAGALECQSALARVEENLRASPSGLVIGVVRPGAPLLVYDRQDQWLGVELEGWMWDQSLQVRSQGAFDLVVSEPAGENLRTQPSGPIVARLATGTLLLELERRPGWIRVRRAGWMWSESVEVSQQSSAVSTPPSANPASPAGASADRTSGNPIPGRPASGTAAPRSAGSPSGSTTISPPAASGGSRAAAPAAVATDPPREQSAREPSGGGSIFVVGGRGAAVLDAPMGDTLATALANASLQVTSREGSWVRVRVEGWVWAPQTDSTAPTPPAVPEDALPAQVVADPARFAGKVVRWDLQFISLERAERIRTDFAEGEPFLLTRPVAGARFFIYVAVPPDRLAEVTGLLPLEQIRVVGRVRTGASALTGGPVIELIEIQGRGRSHE